jgi:hypothetical protein
VDCELLEPEAIDAECTTDAEQDARGQRRAAVSCGLLPVAFSN